MRFYSIIQLDLCAVLFLCTTLTSFITAFLSSSLSILAFLYYEKPIKKWVKGSWENKLSQTEREKKDRKFQLGYLLTVHTHTLVLFLFLSLISVSGHAVISLVTLLKYQHFFYSTLTPALPGLDWTGRRWHRI